MTSYKLTNHRQKVYEEATHHYQACSLDAANINDVWQHKLGEKGRLYSIDQLENALAPGSAVLGDYFDYNYYIDPTFVDLENPITTQILKLGQSDFGHPLLELSIGEQRFSSRYLFNVNLATQIISRLDSLGIQSPKIMEIGAGVAFLFQVLRRYYGNKVTLFNVDLPETLMIQEWLLRNWFPEAPHAFKASHEPLTIAEGGLNFVNAYVLESQDIPVDVVVNLSSIQEMDAFTADSYFAYAARNLSSGGFFHYENHFGHGSTSAAEPSEHNLGVGYTTLVADICHQPEVFYSCEALKLVLGKAEVGEDPESRRFIHRLLWNGFNSGHLDSNKNIVPKLTALPRTNGAVEIVAAAETILAEHRTGLERADLISIQESVHFDHSLFEDSYLNRAWASKGSDNRNQLTLHDFMSNLWAGRSALGRLMSDVTRGPSAWTVDSTRESVSQICASLVASAGTVSKSEYQSATLACFLLPLGDTEQGRKLLLDCAKESTQDYWLIRFAHLLSNYGLTDEAAWALDRIQNTSELNPIFAAKSAEIHKFIGQEGVAEETIASLLAAQDRLSSNELNAVARTGALINRPDIASDALSAVYSRLESGWIIQILETLHLFLLALPENIGKPIVREWLIRIGSDESQPRQQLLRAILEGYVATDGAVGEPVDLALGNLPQDYHSLGWAGHVLMTAGFEDRAERCLEDSLEMNPANFLQCDFVGTIYFSAGKWLRASEAFRAALEVVPYVKHVRVREQYCGLPEVYKNAPIFAGPDGLALVLQTTQGFYSDIIPRAKPVPRFVLR